MKWFPSLTKRKKKVFVGQMHFRQNVLRTYQTRPYLKLFVRVINPNVYYSVTGVF